jgi:cytochrome P450
MNAIAAADHRIPSDKAGLLVDPKAYADGRIYDVYRWLRANEPLGVAEPQDYDPFWVVTRHEDILEASRRNDVLLNGARSSTIATKAASQQAEQTGRILRTLINMDAPDHPKYRLLTQAWFMPPSLKRLEDPIRQIARTAVAKLRARADASGVVECDFVRELALHYPLHVIMTILGVPESDEPRMLQLTQELFGATDPELARGGAVPKERNVNMDVVLDFVNYFRMLSEDRRKTPTEDLASLIANSQIDGQPISDIDAMGYYMIVATAGHDTTSSTTAGALWALADNPGEFRKLKADMSLVSSMVDESIRWTTPVKTFMRTAAEDLELAGRSLKKDDWLMLCYASGNRDEGVFDEPEAFRVDRRPNKQLAFGYGAHLCLGQYLAKMEMRILWEELLPHVSELALAGTPAMSEGIFISGPKRLPVRLKLA